MKKQRTTHPSAFGCHLPSQGKAFGKIALDKTGEASPSPTDEYQDNNQTCRGRRPRRPVGDCLASRKFSLNMQLCANLRVNFALAKFLGVSFAKREEDMGLRTPVMY